MVRNRYEFKVLSCHEDFIKSHTESAQDNGWELAGNVETKHLNGYVWLFIPFKRKIVNNKQK